MTIIQWVNLEKNEAYANDPDIGDIERCGPLSVKALFAKNGIPLSFSIRAVPVGEDNVEYSDAEQQRNQNFKMPNEISGLATEKEVLLDGAVKLPAAGGNKYKLEAKDANGETVESVEVIAKRKLYYQYMYMEDNTGAVTPHQLGQMENHCEENHVVMTKAGPDKKIAFLKTITMTTGGTFDYFIKLIAKSYSLAEPLKKVGCVCVLSNYIASMVLPRPILRQHTIGGPVNPKCVVGSNTVTLKLEKNYYLWHGLDDLDDRNNRWFVRCKVEYMPADGTGPQDITTIWIDRADVAPGGQPAFAYGGYNDVVIYMTPELQALTKKPDGILVFSLHIHIARFTGGFRYPGGGFELTTCSTKSWWSDASPASNEQTWNHEIGHRMGMVAYGNKDHRATNSANFIYRPRSPDAPSTLYGENRQINDKGHKGPHCESGVSYDPSTDEWSGAPACVMFGADRTREGSAPLHYCDECKPIVRKLDLYF